MLIPKLNNSHLLPRNAQNSLCLRYPSIIFLWCYFANHLLRGFSILKRVLKHFTKLGSVKIWVWMQVTKADLAISPNSCKSADQKKFLGCFSAAVHHSKAKNNHILPNESLISLNHVWMMWCRELWNGWWSYGELHSHVICHWGRITCTVYVPV